MSEESTRRARNMVWGLGYTGALTVLQVVQGILLVPLYLAHLDMALYGAWLAVGNVVSMLALADPGIGDYLRVRVARALGTGDSRAAGAVLGSSLGAALLLCLALAATVAMAAPALATLVHSAPDHEPALVRATVVAGAGLAATILALLVTSALEALERQSVVVVVSLSTFAVSLAATVALLLGGWGLTALAAATLVRGALTTLILGGVLAVEVRRRGLALSVTREHLLDLRDTGAVTFISRISSFLTQQSDAFLANIFLGPSAAVVLSMTSRVKDILLSFPSRLSYTALPALAARATRGTDAADGRLRIEGWVMLLATSMSVVLMSGYAALNGAFVGLWVGPDLYAGTLVTALLAGGGILAGARDALGYTSLAHGGLRDVAALNIREAILRLALAVALLPLLGIVGLPLSGLVATLLLLPRAVRVTTALSGHALAARGVRVGRWSLHVGLSLLGAVAFSVLYVPQTVTTFVGASVLCAGILATVGYATEPAVRAAVVTGLSHALRRAASTTSIAP